MDEIIKHKEHKGAVLPVFGIIAAIAVITAIIIWLLLWTKPQPQAKLEQLTPVKVALVAAETRIVQPFEKVTGRLQPIKSAQIRFEVAGKVITRQVEPGAQVSTGTVLMNLEDSDYRDQLQQVAAELLIEEKGMGRDKSLLNMRKKICNYNNKKSSVYRA